MNYKLIVAHCKNNGIGINNELAWNIKRDLKKFSKLTKGAGNNAVIMGKNTWLSIPNTPLKMRDNLILSNSLTIDKNGETEIVKTFTDIKSLKEFCENKQYDTVWVIGGHSIYKEFLSDPSLSELHVTYIDHDYDCDTFFPEYKNDWNREILTSVCDYLDSNKPNVKINYYDYLYQRKTR